MQNNNLKGLYTDDYFQDRFDGIDQKRDQSYLQEYAKITNYITEGKVLDVGCGMGNFLNVFDDKKWEKYGIEISDFAANEAKKSGIKIINFTDYSEYFDLIIFRGVLQHLDTPFLNIQQAINMLKPNGYIVFLATPNSNCIHYKLFNSLPMLDPKRNFMIPSDIMMKDSLTNLGLSIEEISYPYIQSPYSNLLKDHILFLARCVGIKNKFPFWKNMMEIYAKKN